MRTHAPFRRGIALASSGALAAGIAWLPAGSASAAPPVAEYIAQAQTSADSSCTAPSGTTFISNSKNLTHGRAKGSVNLGTTWTSTTNSSDVTTVTGHYSGKAQAVKRNGALRSASVTGSGRLSITRALGASSTCHASVQLLSAIALVTKQPAGWYYVTRNTTRSALTETVVVPGSSLSSLVKPVIFEAYQGGANTVTQRAFVPHGNYVTVMVAGIEGGDFPILIGKNGATVTRGARTNSMSAVFRAAGSALAKVKGSARHFVKFPASVSCTHHSASLTWRGSASQVASGAFFVNGKKKASVSNPNSGHRVVLHHVSATADNKITVKLSLKSGAKQTAKDMFVPCHE